MGHQVFRRDFALQLLRLLKTSTCLGNMGSMFTFTPNPLVNNFRVLDFQTKLSPALFCISAVVLVNLGNQVYGDSVQLRNKGIVPGEILSTKDTNSVVVKTYDGILLQLPSTSVSNVSKSGEREKVYIDSLAGRPDTAASNKEIAKECSARDQVTLAKAHIERVVEHDPTDATAWSSLGYIFDDGLGEWIPRELMNKRLGLVVYEKKRMTLHAAELMRAKKKIKDDGVAFRRELERVYKYARDTGKNGEAARTFLANLNDPRANPYLEKIILDSIRARRDPQQELDILLRMPKRSALKQFINIVRRTDLPTVVEPILEELRSDEFMRVNAMVAFVEDLNPKKGAKPDMDYINRAGRNLEALGDERIIPALIGRLNTLVRTTIAIKPQTGQQHGSNGVSHSTGGNITQENLVNHPGVLQALNTITGESFGYNEAAWRLWYARTYSNVNVDSRRFD